MGELTDMRTQCAIIVKSVSQSIIKMDQRFSSSNTLLNELWTTFKRIHMPWAEITYLFNSALRERGRTPIWNPHPCLCNTRAKRGCWVEKINRIEFQVLCGAEWEGWELPLICLSVGTLSPPNCFGLAAWYFQGMLCSYAKVHSFNMSKICWET